MQEQPEGEGLGDLEAPYQQVLAQQPPPAEEKECIDHIIDYRCELLASFQFTFSTAFAVDTPAFALQFPTLLAGLGCLTLALSNHLNPTAKLVLNVVGCLLCSTAIASFVINPLAPLADQDSHQAIEDHGVGLFTSLRR